jgi:hypothetical protein
VVFCLRPKRRLFFIYGAYMRFLSFPSRSAWRRAGAALALSALLSPAFALPVMEMRAEDFLPMAAELKKSLNLNSNQQTLWQQTESKTRNMLRERKLRRDRLQAATQAGTENAGAELRDLSRAVDDETTVSAGEEKLMREWWLTVNQQVTISGARADDTEARRMSTAAKMVFGREELDRNGDTSVSEVLKRLPGVTSAARPAAAAAGAHARHGQWLYPDAGQRRASAARLLARVAVARPGRAHRGDPRPGGRAQHPGHRRHHQHHPARRLPAEGHQLRLADNIEQGRHGANVSLAAPGKSAA